MKRYIGGQKVQQGVYASLATGEIVQVHQPPWVLPGKADARYVKMPATLMVLLGPLAGLALVVFLPLVGIVGGAGFSAVRTGRGIQALVRTVLHPAAVEWRPGEAYLAQKGPGKETGTPGKAEHDLAELEQKVAEHRIEAWHSAIPIRPRERKEPEQRVDGPGEQDRE